MISITFDDGFKNNFLEALPILKKYNMKATFYVSSGFINMPDFMTSADLLEIQNLGNEIGSHGDTHPNLVFSFGKKRKEEIFDSKKKLESFGVKIDTFAYPYGWHNKKIRQHVKESGYKGARAFRPYRNFNTNKTDIFALSTVAVTRNTNSENIKDLIQNNPCNTWTILTFHGITKNPRFWDCLPEKLEEILSCIDKSGLKTVTISEGIDIMYNQDMRK